MPKSWIDLGREIQALAQNGLTFSTDPFDRERYTALQKIASEMMSNASSHTSQRIESLFSAEKGYATPKIDVRAAIFHGGEILLVKEKESACWTLPGGYVDVNESLSEATAREVQEEAGVRVRATKIAAVFDHRKHGYKPHLYHFYKFYMICEWLSGEPKTNAETLDARFFSKDAIETLDLDPSRVTRAHILRTFDHAENAALATDFD